MDGRTDGPTDRQNPSGYYSALHCEQTGHAVIKLKKVATCHLWPWTFSNELVTVEEKNDTTNNACYDPTLAVQKQKEEEWVIV